MCKKDCTSCDACKKNNLSATNKTIRKVFFSDSAALNNSEKSLVSVRDGVVDYLGIELGIEPFDKNFKVYRSPETIIELAPKLVGIPITDDHIDMDGEAYNVIGKIISSDIEPYISPIDQSTIAVKNIAELIDEIDLQDKSDISLGFFADLEPANDSDPYDFRQTNIDPHHAGRVKNGRCGEKCKFNDEETMKKKFKFIDEDGSLNLEELSQIIADLPNVISKMDVEEAKALVMSLKKMREDVLSEREDVQQEIDEDDETDKKNPAIDEDDSDDKDPMLDEDLDEDEKTIVKVKSMDSRKYLDSVKKFIDSKVKLATKDYATVVEKARTFLDEKYKFADKSAIQIMRDALATQYSEQFTDHELSTAFKLLKHTKSYEKFGDAKTGTLESTLKDQEIK